MSSNANPISCNNCGSRSHLWAECDLEINRDLKRENARAAHNSSGSKSHKLDKWAKRLACKREGRSMNVAFLMEMLEANLDQLELKREAFNNICPLEIDEDGFCAKEGLVLKFREEIYNKQHQLLDLISAAKGRAEVWREDRDDTPGWDKEIFEGLLEEVQAQRNLFYNEVLSAARGIGQASLNAVLILSDRVKFEEFASKVGSGLESNHPLELKLFNVLGPMKDLAVVFNRMLASYTIIKNYNIVSPFHHQLLEKDLLLQFLVLENKFLKLQNESLQESVDNRNLCPICQINPINFRLVTEEGNCTHCVCEICAHLLPLTNVAYDDFFPMMRQTCPYCREQVILEACVRLTLC